MSNAAATGDIRYNVNNGGPLVYSGASWEEISLDPKLLERIERMEKVNEKIMERLAILEDPSPEQLEQFKVLKDLHDKYKFIETLCEGKDDTS